MGVSVPLPPLMTVAAVDRIIHYATIIEVEGESYRKKQQALKK